jgi:hypothetical protein
MHFEIDSILALLDSGKYAQLYYSSQKLEQRLDTH